MTAFVEDPCDTFIRVLACSIPYLKLNGVLAIYFHDVVPEFDSDRHVLVLLERIVNKPEHDA